MKSKNWIAVTAGFSSSEFEDAAKRVQRELKSLYSFSKVLIVDSQSLPIYAPNTYTKYKRYLNRNFVGYGFYCWKPEIVDSVLSGNFGECDGVVWVDAGCEIFSTFWTRWKFRKLLKKTNEIGYSVFSLDTPEKFYTKKDVFLNFNSVDLEENSPQIQATYFILTKEVGLKITNLWASKALIGIHMLDESKSKDGEVDKFVVHRHDQSLFSLSVKSFSLTERMEVPHSGNRGLLSQLRAINTPIWASRNRRGRSIKNRVIRLLELVF